MLEQLLKSDLSIMDTNKSSTAKAPSQQARRVIRARTGYATGGVPGLLLGKDGPDA